MDGQMSIFDFIQLNKFKPLTAYAKRGSNMSGWNKRIMNFFKIHKSINERIAFLKDEYGIGGFESPEKKPCFIHSIWHNGTGNTIQYYDENMNNLKIKISYKELAEEIEKLINNGEYMEE